MPKLPLELLLNVLEYLTIYEIITLYPNLVRMRPSIITNRPKTIKLNELMEKNVICNCIHGPEPNDAIKAICIWETLQKCIEHDQETLKKAQTSYQLTVTSQMIYEEKEIFFRPDFGVPFPRIGNIMKEIELYGAPYDIKINIGKHFTYPFKESRERNVTKLLFLYPIILENMYEPHVFYKGGVTKIIFKSYYLDTDSLRLLVKAPAIQLNSGNKNVLIYILGACLVAGWYGVLILN